MDQLALQPKIESWMNFNIDKQQLPQYLVIGILSLYMLHKINLSGKTLFFIITIIITLILYHVYSNKNAESHKLLVKQFGIEENSQNTLVFNDIILLQLLIKIKNLSISDRHIKLLIHELNKFLLLVNKYQEEVFYKYYYDNIRDLQKKILNQVASFELLLKPGLTYVKEKDVFLEQNQVHKLFLIINSLEQYLQKHIQQLIFVGSKNWELNETIVVSHPMDLDSSPEAFSSYHDTLQSTKLY